LDASSDRPALSLIDEGAEGLGDHAAVAEFDDPARLEPL
jgi:hypothetical protein